MATATGPFSSYPSLLTLRVECYEISTNIGSNVSTARADVYIDFSGGSATSYNNTVNLNVNGNTGSWNIGTQSYSGAGARLVVSGFDTAVTHNTDGSKSISFSVSASTGGWGTASASGTLTLTDFNRSAGTPASCSATVAGGVFTVAIGASTSYITPFNYYTSYASSSDGGTTYGSWSSDSSAIPSTTSPLQTTYSGLTPGLTYKFRVRAYNGVDSYSAYRESSPVFLTAGGKRRTSDNTWVLTATAAKRRNAGNTAFGNLTTAKRFNGTAWVNLS